MIAHETRQTRTGFTTIELVTALFVMTVGLFGVFQLYHVGIGKIRVLNESAIAMRSLQNEVETLRSLPFAERRKGDKPGFMSVTPGLESLVNVQQYVSMNEYEDGRLPVLHVTAEIAWTGENGRTIRKNLTTLIANHGRAHDQ